MADVPLLNSAQLMDRVLHALDQKQPLSVISVGATESFVMAQYSVLSEDEFLNHPEAKIANQKAKEGFLHRGVTFPNIQLRDEVVGAVRNADIVGYNTRVTFRDAGGMTLEVFNAYNITPPAIFEAYLRRTVMFSQQAKFHDMLKGRKIVLVGAPAEQAKVALNRDLRDQLHFDIVATLPIEGYEQVPEVKKQLDALNYDLCLLAAGTNAILLATYIAQIHGKVAFDIGSGMNSLHTGEVYSDYWLEHLIGLDNLMKM